MTTEEFKIIQSSIPGDPGVYKFLDDSHEILYVGKAKNLRKRLSSYFGVRKNMPYKTRTMVRQANNIDFTIVETENDALLLENTLIKKNQPRYNVMMKDGKSYSYICIKNERFPRVFFTRKVVRDGSSYFGPYTSKHKVNQILELIRRLFPLRTCKFNLSEENIQKTKFKICLEYHIHNCLGPCEGFETEASYLQRIDQIKNILRGRFKPVRDFIMEEMENHANSLEFEKAQWYKSKLELFEDYQSKSTVVSHTIKDLDVFSIESHNDYAFVNYLKVVNGTIINAETIELKKNLNVHTEDLLRYSIPILRERYQSISPEIVLPIYIEGIQGITQITIPQRGDKKKLLELSNKNVKYYTLQKRKEEATRKRKQTSVERILKGLKEDLHMKEIPLHIECFDNSNIQGSNPVASCVVFKNAKPSKKDYRRFNIKTVKGSNDFASMEEVVFRRYSRLLNENKALPQLVIIDGGKGQLSSAVASLKKLNIFNQLTIIGIAKKLEEIYFPGDSIPLHINKKSESLKLIQQARNEAHRFAINFHRDKRSKEFIQSALESIPGVGQKTIAKLLSHFGSVEKINKAKLDELENIIGKSLSTKVRHYLSDLLN